MVEESRGRHARFVRVRVGAMVALWVGLALLLWVSATACEPHPQTPGVHDSFGDQAPSAPLGPGWSAVDAYFNEFPRQPGECPQAVHDRYWVRDNRGVTHPTWHPPVDPSGCAFGHEHGDDPRTSDLYTFSGGVPFAATMAAGGGGHRHEDHVGHKVVVQDNWELVNGDPQNGSRDANSTGVLTRTGIECDWLSKVHQGSWSPDALGNNGHEYFLNLHCSDGVSVRIKSLLTFGPPGEVTNLCKVGETQHFVTGVAPTMPIALDETLDGKREFRCLSDLYDETPPVRRLEELWKPDGVIRLGAGWINFSPYYVVLNPARYVDHDWVVRGASNAFVSTANLCFDDNPAYRRATPAFCDDVPAALESVAPDARISDPQNPMNGTLRVIHPKGLQLDTTAAPGTDNTIRFCTNALGRDARVLSATEFCDPDEIEQLVSRIDRRNWSQNGSDVNSYEDPQGNLRGAGYLNEWVRDFGHPTIRYPN